MTDTIITDRTGTPISQDMIDKATRLAPTVESKVESLMYRVTGDHDTYTVAVDSSGASGCTCFWSRETDRLCSHQLAVWLAARHDGKPVRFARIDGPKMEVVQPDDPFEGLA